MIEPLYAVYDAVHDDTFVYLEDDSPRDWWLLIQTHSKAYFIVNEQEYIMPAETVALYPPNVKIHYGAYGEPYCNDWIRFYTDEKFITGCNIPLGMPFVVSEFDFTHSLFKQIASENFLDNKHRSDNLKLLFKLMFNKLEESLSFDGADSQIRDLLAIRIQLKNNPAYDWSIPFLAEKLHISISYFHNLYKKNFGISCTEDIINMRIELAKDYLEHSSQTISSIADNCGYNNVEHFSRQFKKFTGISPGQYRKQYK